MTLLWQQKAAQYFTKNTDAVYLLLVGLNSITITLSFTNLNQRGWCTAKAQETDRRAYEAWSMVLYVSSQDCSGGAGRGVVVALRPGNGSEGVPHGMWRYMCCQRRPTLTLTSCRYTRMMGTDTYSCFLSMGKFCGCGILMLKSTRERYCTLM